MTYRQRLLLAFIRQQRSATAQDMAERFSVSRETIRRDVLQLEKSGLVQRYHGGVCLRDPGDEAAFSIRLRRHADKKEKIGAQVARRIPDGATLVLDNSSTVVYVARQLAMKTALTIMTPSLEVAQVAGRHCPDARILLPPGQLRQHDYTLVGPSVLDYFQRVRSDYFIFPSRPTMSGRGPWTLMYSRSNSSVWRAWWLIATSWRWIPANFAPRRTSLLGWAGTWLFAPAKRATSCFRGPLTRTTVFA